MPGPVSRAGPIAHQRLARAGVVEPRVNGATQYLELHFRHLLRGRVGLEVGLGVEPERARDEVVREPLDRLVEALYLVVVAHALDGDAVLGARELVLQADE